MTRLSVGNEWLSRTVPETRRYLGVRSTPDAFEIFEGAKESDFEGGTGFRGLLPDRPLSAKQGVVDRVRSLIDVEILLPISTTFPKIMLYSTLVKFAFRSLYGDPPDLSRLEGAEGLGLVLVADGVGGLDLCGTALRYVMGAERLPFVVKVIHWGHGLGRWHADLTNPVNRDEGARKIVAEVVAFRHAHPGKPVHLIGKSGGTGVVVRALERLPADSVDVVVLLAPALSPRYDLSKALHAVQKRMVVFWSPLDVIVLGAGTRLFGTIDRVRSVSAGLVGFRPPSPDRALAYAKLKQIRWRFSMAGTGYFGGHVGTDLPAFLRKYVVPLLVAESPQTTDSLSSQADRAGDR